METPQPHHASSKVWKVEFEKRDSYSSLISDWNFESPATGLAGSAEGWTSINAWALSLNPDVQNRLHLVVRLPGRTLSLPPSLMRPDVISHVLKAPPDGHPQLCCGFRYSIPAVDALAGFDVGFEVDGVIHLAARVSIE